jgi:hypothetical protein
MPNSSCVICLAMIISCARVPYSWELMDLTGDAKSLGIDHSALSNILEDFARDPEALKRLRDATINAYDVDDCTNFFL